MGNNKGNDVQKQALIDNFGRPINYLRLAITDRCNLRCRYCMPRRGFSFVPHSEILSFEELERVVRIFVGLGISKLRITGGEPFVRKGCLDLIKKFFLIPGIDSLHVTTNGVAASQYLGDLKKLGVAGINLSLDSLERNRFQEIARYDSLDAVKKTLNGALRLGIPLKINSVVMEDTSDDELAALAELARNQPVTVRFIEKMPFSGKNASSGSVQKKRALHSRLHRIFPELIENTGTGTGTAPSTASLFSVPDFRGKIGIIEGYARRFCQSCNKVRITPQGMMKTCLYDNGVLDLKELLRSGKDDRAIGQAIIGCIQERVLNGHVAEVIAARCRQPTMASIGG